MFRDQMCTNVREGWLGKALGTGRPQRRPGGGRSLVPRAEEAGGCSSEERICLNLGNSR